METDSDAEVEGAWEVIVLHLLGKGNDDLKGYVKDSLRLRASQLSDILKLDIPLQEKRTRIGSVAVKGGFEKKKKGRIGEGKGETKAYHCPAQLKALRKIWVQVNEIFWKETLFQDYLVQDGLIEDADLQSISDKTSRNDRNVAIWNFLLGLSRDDLVLKVIPHLRKTEHEKVAKVLEEALSVEDSGERISTEEIMDLVNPRRVGNILYEEGIIKEGAHADLISPKVSRAEKRQIMGKIPWVYFVSSLKEEYRHFYGICVDGRSGRELMEAGDIEILDATFDEEKGGQQGFEGRGPTDATSRKPDCPWCSCNKCRVMSSDEEHVCCHQPEGTDCLSQGEMMNALTAGGRMLSNSMRWLMPKSKLHRILRRGLYRQLNVWLNGQLGPCIRKPLPSCCVWRIRDTIPDPHGAYEGFRSSAAEMRIQCQD